MTRAVVLDIEGTVSPLSVVRDTLFPYARQRIAEWVRCDEHEVKRIVEEVRAELNDSDAGLDEVIDRLKGWSDADVKATPLKSLQGLIWAHGFAAGELTAHVYDDVPPVLRSWTRSGVRLCVYSSGSEHAQRLWFGNTQHGDLSALICDHFDTRSAGPKKEVSSYHTIAGAIGIVPGDIAFLSDARAELDTARKAGWHTVGVSREQDGLPEVGDHPVIHSFAEVGQALPGPGTLGAGPTSAPAL